MAINNKYNLDERKIANQIILLKYRKNQHKKRVIELDKLIKNLTKLLELKLKQSHKKVRGE